MEAVSIWDQRHRKFVKRGYKAARVTIEFPRTKQIKIANHTLAEIDFDSRLELNFERDQTISRDIKKLTSSGYRYENIGNVYMPEGEEISANELGEFEILAHGEAVPGELNNGNENCRVQGLKCLNGSDTNCLPGKCVIGKIKQVTKYKWLYTSASLYNSVPVEYFIGGKESFELKTIIRGAHTNPDGTVVNVNSPASKATTIHLPPANYFHRAFSETFIKFFNYTYALDGSRPLEGIATTEEDFIREVIALAYRSNRRLETGPTYSSLADSPVSEEVFKAIEDILFSLGKAWKDKARTLMDQRWVNRFAKHETNREFITYILRELKTLFLKCIQVTNSGIKYAKIKSISDESVRPIYLRLPSAALNYRPDESEDVLVIAEENDRFNVPISALDIGTIVTLSDRSLAYQFIPRIIYNEDERRQFRLSPIISSRTKEELYSPRDAQSWYRVPEDRLPTAPIAKWILGGADEFLREKKLDIESFYYTYLDPSEASPKNLDWLAQHVGLAGEVWNTEWDVAHKRTMIKNALGWYEKELTQIIGNKEYKTIKGEVLNEAPFVTTSAWRETDEITNENEVDITNVDISKISSIIINDILDKNIINGRSIRTRNGGLADIFSIYKQEWDGLFESKGSILTLVFLFSLFGVKSHTAKELEITKAKLKNGEVKAQLKVKNGLRSQEVDAPILLPVKFNPAQVGNENDYENKAFDNQLIADRTAIADIEQSKNIFFRLPFYYNRNGKTWDLVESIAKYWTSNTLNSRVQYAYLSADLWRIGDAFFEPRVVFDESILDASAVLTEEGNYLVTEDNTTIIIEA